MAESWIQHALRRTGWRPQRQVASLTVLGMIVAVFVGALYLSQASSTSTLGRQLNELIEERDRIQQENEALRAEIAGYRTVERLLRRAQELGFVQAAANQIQYLVVDGYNPGRAVTVVELQAVENVLPDYDESFVGWVQQGWDWLTEQVESFTNQGAG